MYNHINQRFGSACIIMRIRILFGVKLHADLDQGGLLKCESKTPLYLARRMGPAKTLRMSGITVLVNA